MAMHECRPAPCSGFSNVIKSKQEYQARWLSKKSVTINCEAAKVSAPSIYRGRLGGEVQAIKTISTTKSGETQFPKKTVEVAPISAVCNLTCVPNLTTAQKALHNRLTVALPTTTSYTVGFMW